MSEVGSFWNKVKFHLGLPCIVQYGDEWVITRRFLFLPRECRDRTDTHWWTGKEYWPHWCFFKTKEEAEAAYTPPKPEVRRWAA